MIEPLGSRVLIKARPAEEKTSSGIMLPNTKGQVKQIADVVATGTGYVLASGEVIPLSVKPGDQIIYEKFANTISVHDDESGENYFIINANDIVARIR